MKKILSMITLTVLMVALAGSCTKNLEERLDKADTDLAGVRTAIGQYEKLQSDITSVVQSLQNEVGSRPASEQKTVWECIAALQSQNNTVSAAISALKALVGEESVSDQIAEALAELTDSYDLDNLEATLQELKAGVAEKFDPELLKSKVENLSKTIRNFDYYLAKLTEIEGMLQSVSIIPAYSNGSVKAEDGNLEMRCIVTPASVLSNISNLKECFTLTVDSLSTRAGDGEIPVTTAKVEDKDLGIVKITADLSAYLPEDDSQTLILALNLKLGASNLTTEFVPVTDASAKPIVGVQLWKDGPYWATVNLGEVEDHDPAYPAEYGALYNFADAVAEVAKLGDGWRLPTGEELQALVDNCTKNMETRKDGTGADITGCCFTGATDGYADKSIFLPVAGYDVGDGRKNAGYRGYYWSSTEMFADFVNLLRFDEDFGAEVGFDNRSHGLSVRAVRDAE